MDLETAINYVNNILKSKVGRELRKPEEVILTASWQGMTYEQMADSCSYSANYLMRDIAPKLWKTLSAVFQKNIGKSNFRIELCNSYDLLQSEPLKSHQRKIQQKLRVRDGQDTVSLPSVYYGNTAELKKLQQLILGNKCQLLRILGLSGSGKTLLMKSLEEQIQSKYEVVIWRNFASAPTPSDLLEDLLRTGFNIIEKDRTQLLPQLVAQMRSHSCLIMLDGIEKILQTKTLGGKYLPGYENYGEFFELVGNSTHQSCVIVTSLENFGATAGSSGSPIYEQKLVGLSSEAAKALLKAENITITAAEETLIEYYQGNPAILIMVAQIIRELFNGNVEEFLFQKSLVIGNIVRLLNRTGDRLSVLETELLYWLASEFKPMSLSAIQQDIPLSIYPVELIEALESLMGRSLIETTQIKRRSVFVLSPMVREFTTNQFIAQLGNNFSLANRRNSTLVNKIIDLGQVIQQKTQLSQWLQNHFESGWQPVEKLFAATGRSPARLRSAFNLRGEGVVKRFKQIELDRENSQAVLLLIAISQEESAFKICVQAQPIFSQQTLPAKLKLNLIDTEDRVLASIQAQAQDNFIQLPYFRGVENEQFKIGLNIDSHNYEEEFFL